MYESIIGHDTIWHRNVLKGTFWQMTVFDEMRLYHRWYKKFNRQLPFYSAPSQLNHNFNYDEERHS